METVPVKYGSIQIHKSPLLNDRLLLGIDIGSSITKVMFLHHNNQSQLLDNAIDCLTLDYGLFNNEDILNALKWTKERAYLPKNRHHTAHVTGEHSWMKKDIVQSILGLKTEYIDDSLASLVGHKILIVEIGLENLIAPPVEVQSYGKIESQFLDKFSEACNSKFSQDTVGNGEPRSLIFPCLVNSESGFLYFDKEGKSERIGYTMINGENIFGLAKCLLDINKYDELVLLASGGDRANIDMQVKDMLGDDGTSPYGNIPQEIPVFPFGKCMDFNKGLEYFKREDVAVSLVGFYCICTNMQSVPICQLKRIQKIYIADSMFRSEVFRKEMKRAMMTFPIGVEFVILDCDYVSTLGAMLCQNGDNEIY